MTTIRTSDGEDCVSIHDSIFASLDVNTGLHDDLLTFGLNSVVLGNAALNGSGGDNDTLLDGPLVVGGTKTVKGFEIDL